MSPEVNPPEPAAPVMYLQTVLPPKASPTCSKQRSDMMYSDETMKFVLIPPLATNTVILYRLGENEDENDEH